MTTKEIRLDLEATVSEALFGHGHAHYGYWPDGAPSTLDLKALGEAQQAYFELLASRIPEDVETILDVGSGTGANALGLIGKGFRVDCVCPSPHLNDLACAKLPGDAEVHTCTFETFSSERRWDLALFAESFHYIELDTALRQLARYAERSVLIFDYFRRPGQTAGDGVRGAHGAFLQAVSTHGDFRVESDEDMTAAICPTFEVLDRLKTEHFAPLVARSRAVLAKSYPWRMRLVELLLGRRLDKLVRPGRRADTFPQRFEYRLIRLVRR